MKKVALTLASAIFAISIAGAGAAFAQTAPATGQPDAAATAEPAAKAAPKKHQKVAMNKHTGTKAPKKAAKHPAAAPATEEPNSTE